MDIYGHTFTYIHVFTDVYIYVYGLYMYIYTHIFVYIHISLFLTFIRSYKILIIHYEIEKSYDIKIIYSLSDLLFIWITFPYLMSSVPLMYLRSRELFN